jgi:hypothetical protein
MVMAEKNNLMYLLNRVTVSSMLIGINSKKGSLVKRLALLKVIK